MQKVLTLDSMAQVADNMDEKVLGYIGEGQIETFESYEKFNIIAFDWYDVRNNSTDSPQIMIYLDRDDVFFFCENEHAFNRVDEIVRNEISGEPVSNEKLTYRFFVKLLKDNMGRLEQYEAQITEEADRIISGELNNPLESILDYRRELLRLKRYYEQLASIMDELCANDNGLLSEADVRLFDILHNRVMRFLSTVSSMRDHVEQIREAYQSQIDIKQNDLMRVFTVVTSIFLPLTLLVGWYGMNFNMPEFRWEYGYPVVIAVSVVICVSLLVIFKKKKWM